MTAFDGKIIYNQINKGCLTEFVIPEMGVMPEITRAVEEMEWS